MLSLNMKAETSCSVFSYMCYFYTAWTKYSFSLQLKQANTDWTLTKNQNSSIKRYGELNNLVQLHPEGIMIWLKLHSQGKNHDQCFWFAVIIPSTWTAPSCVRPCTRTPKTTWLPWPPASTGPGVLTWEAWKVRGQSVLCKIPGLRALMAHTRGLVHVPAVLMVQTSLFVRHHISVLKYLCRTTEYKMSPSSSGVTSRPWTPRCTPPPQQQQPSVPPHPHPHPPPDYHHNVYIPGTPSGFCTLRPAAQRSELDVHNSFSTFGKKRRLQMSPQGEAAIINNDLYNDWESWMKGWRLVIFSCLLESRRKES